MHRPLPGQSAQSVIEGFINQQQPTSLVTVLFGVDHRAQTLLYSSIGTVAEKFHRLKTRRKEEEEEEKDTSSPSSMSSPDAASSPIAPTADAAPPACGSMSVWAMSDYACRLPCCSARCRGGITRRKKRKKRRRRPTLRATHVANRILLLVLLLVRHLQHSGLALCVQKLRAGGYVRVNSP
jgi:hypothetical protein